MTSYKRVAGNGRFAVDYPAAYWNGLTVEEQLEIVNFYNSTYGKKKKAIPEAARQPNGASGAVNGRYCASRQ